MYFSNLFKNNELNDADIKIKNITGYLQLLNFPR